MSEPSEARETAHNTTHPAPREGRALIDATRPFASEHPLRTAWETLTTFAVLGAALALAANAGLARAPRVLATVVAGLTVVRGFILYHDALHGALYRGKTLFARALRGAMWLYGLLVLTPPKVWRSTHNYHHANTAKIVGSHIGSFPMLTTALYRRATPSQKLLYRAVRHPLTMLFGYATVFLWGMCLGPFLRDRAKHWDSLLALVLHAALGVAVVRFAGLEAWLHAVLGPLAIACASGAYLFYAQHNFPGIEVQPREKWSYTRAALESSSYLETGPVLAWFTGNIGYHHVHHLNPGVPFYRLPEAMAAVPELQNPRRTSLHPRDVWSCLRLALWDPMQKRMVTFAEAEAGAAGAE